MFAIIPLKSTNKADLSRPLLKYGKRSLTVVGADEVDEP